jgi:hypothetical protein
VRIVKEGICGLVAFYIDDSKILPMEYFVYPWLTGRDDGVVPRLGGIEHTFFHNTYMK